MTYRGVRPLPEHEGHWPLPPRLKRHEVRDMRDEARRRVDQQELMFKKNLVAICPYGHLGRFRFLFLISSNGLRTFLKTV
jgi:hypothetical protein